MSTSAGRRERGRRTSRAVEVDCALEPSGHHDVSGRTSNSDIGRTSINTAIEKFIPDR